MNLLGWLAGLLGRVEENGAEPLGRRAERLAADYLVKQGMRIVERSARSSIGEIDLVATDGETTVFVEVRSRLGRAKGEPWETIRAKKRRKLSSLAALYLKSHPAMGKGGARFDVVSVVWIEPAEERFELEHFPNAFELEGPWLT
jgi:putative endonuclease